MLDRPQLTHQAEQVKEAVEANCRIIENGRMMYAWSVNLQGQYDIYDEPPGSLQLFACWSKGANQHEIPRRYI